MPLDASHDPAEHSLDILTRHILAPAHYRDQDGTRGVRRSPRAQRSISIRASTATPPAHLSWPPCAALAPCVREFALRHDTLGTTQVYQPLPARTDCFLQFYLQDRYQVVTLASGAVHLAPRCVLVGPHTRRREDLILSGSLKIFTIRFTSIGFFALFGIPARLVCNTAENAEQVLGSPLRELEARLAAAGDTQLKSIAEHSLVHLLAATKTPPNQHIALRMSTSLRSTHLHAPLTRIAAQHGRSVRQMERIFLDHVGVTPKLFARLNRLEAAMALAETHPGDWASVAAAAGYFDQSHLIRDFKSLNAATPVEFAALGRAARELRGKSPPMSHSSNPAHAIHP